MRPAVLDVCASVSRLWSLLFQHDKRGRRCRWLGSLLLTIREFDIELSEESFLVEEVAGVLVCFLRIRFAFFGSLILY